VLLAALSVALWPAVALEEDREFLALNATLDFSLPTTVYMSQLPTVKREAGLTR